MWHPPHPFPFRRFTKLPFAAASRGGHGGSSCQALAEWRSGEGWYGTLVKVRTLFAKIFVSGIYGGSLGNGLVTAAVVRKQVAGGHHRG